MQYDLGPFATALTQAERIQEEASQSTQRDTCSCCFWSNGSADDSATGAVPADAGTEVSTGSTLPTSSSAPSSSSNVRLSSKLSGLCGWGRSQQIGSNAYSDVEWFENLSKQLESFSGDQSSTLPSMDELLGDLSLRSPWVPDPPLMFGAPGLHFLAFPLDVSRYVGYWVRDGDRTTPPPKPIDVMLEANFIVQKVHNSIASMLIEETDRGLRVSGRPSFLPAGVPWYTEHFDRHQPTETSWALRRDLKAGRSYGRMYALVNGTLVFRVQARPMLSKQVDVITEEYLKLEEGGQVLVVRQCCLQVSTGKCATQYLVVRRCERPRRR